jgi:hypothetical protein
MLEGLRGLRKIVLKLEIQVQKKSPKKTFNSNKKHSNVSHD